MPKTLRSPRQLRLTELLIAQRKKAGLSQAALADALGRYQSVIAAMESGSRRIDVVEFLDIAEAVGFDIHEMIDALLATKTPAA
jgi:transcriptional regulator with XRE-family HTH domain